MTTTQFSANKTPFSISDILTDLKVNGANKSEESMRFLNHQEASGVKQMLYGINSTRDSSSSNNTPTTDGYPEMASATRKRMEEKRAGSGSFVRRGSLECFLIDSSKNQSYADRRDSYFAEQTAQKPLDMRRSVGSISDHYDSGEAFICHLHNYLNVSSITPGASLKA